MPRLARALVAAALAAALSAPAAGAAVDQVDPLPTTNGEVQAIARAGDVLWIGGDFTRVAPRTGPAAALSLPEGARDPDFPVVGAGTVTAVVRDGAGGWYVGGEFETVGGQPRHDLAHVLADGTVDPAFAPDPDRPVKDLALHDGTLYVAGEFTQIGGAAREVLAAVDAATGEAEPFDAGLANSFIGGLALAITDDRVYLGGNFVTASGDGATLAAFDRATGDQVDAFAAEAPGIVNDLVLSGNRLYVAGAVFLDGVPLVVLDAEDGSQDQQFATELDGTVEDLLLAGDTLYAAGSFGAPRAGLAALDPQTGATRAFDAGLDGFSEVHALGLDGPRLVLGGLMSFAGGANQHLAVVDAASGERAPGPADGPGAMVRALAIQGDRVVVGGEFTGVGGEARSGLAAIDAVDGHLLPAAPQLDGSVFTLVTDGTRLYAGGDFRNVAGAPRARLAAFDAGTGELDPAFHPGADDSVDMLLLDGTRLLIAGAFTRVSGQPRGGLAAVDTADGSLLGLRADADGRVQDLALVGRRLYAAGTFTAIDDYDRPGVAALDADTGEVDEGFEPPPVVDEVYGVAASEERVYIGGFSSGTSLVALDAETGAPDDGFDAGLDRDIIYDLEVLGDSLYVGGSFGEIGGGRRTGFAQLDAATGEVRPLDLGLDRFVFDVEVEPGAVYVAGDFKAAGGAAQQGFASFTEAPAADAAPAVAGTAEVGQTVTCAGATFTGVVARRDVVWQRDGAPIADAGGDSYVIGDADEGRSLTCEVTARNLGGAAQAVSAAVTPRRPAPQQQGPAPEEVRPPPLQLPPPPPPAPFVPPAAGPPVPPVTPDLDVRRRRSLEAALDRGVPALLTCSAPCTVRVELFVFGRRVRGGPRRLQRVGAADARLRPGVRSGLAVSLDPDLAPALARRRRPFNVIVAAWGIGSDGRAGSPVVRRTVVIP